MRCRLLGGVVALLVTGLGALAAPTPECPIPLAKGSRWLYAGRAEWSPVNGPDAKTEALTWTCEVIRSDRRRGAVVAVFCDFPLSASGYAPGQPSRYTVALVWRGRVSLYDAESRAEAMATADRAPERWPDSALPLLALPIRAGQRIGQEPSRRDTWYCWYVETVRGRVAAAAGALRVAGHVIRMAYRTNPGEQHMDVAPGLGIVRFSSRHHGTTAITEMHLVSYSPGRPH